MKLKPIIHLLLAECLDPFPADAEDLASGVIQHLAESKRLIGITTCIDESSVYHGDLSSPFFLEEPNRKEGESRLVVDLIDKTLEAIRK